jgi:hypothetical protein
MIERLNFVMACLQKLQDQDRIRAEGNQVFQEGKAELADMIDTYVEPVTLPAPVVYQVMTEDQVGRVAEGIATGVGGMIPAPLDVPAFLSSVRDQIEASDVAVLSAIATSQGDVITALKPAQAA